jgi:hypothetical protein
MLPAVRSRLVDLAGRRPLTLAVTLTLVWHLVLFVVDDLLPPLSPHWFPALGATVVNAVLAVLTVALVVWLRWGRQSALGWRRPDRHWWLAVPLPAEALSYGLRGLDPSPTVLVSTALLTLSVGLAEESLSRGLVQRVLAPLGPAAAAVGVGVLFGLGHALSGWWFGRPWDDTVSIVVSAGVYGFCLAALRWHLGTIWPLVVLHALADFTQLASPGNLPFGVRLGIVLAMALYGWWLLRLLDRRPDRLRLVTPGAREP